MEVEVERTPGPAGETDDVIVTAGLTKVFQGRGGAVHAVDDLNLRVQRGEIFGLLGPNGRVQWPLGRLGLLAGSRGAIGTLSCCASERLRGRGAS